MGLAEETLWKWVTGLVAAVIAGVVALLIKRSYDRVDADVNKVSSVVKDAFKDFKEGVQKDITEFRREITAELREVSRENKNNAQQIVAVTERLGATIERVANWEDKVEAMDRRWEERFEAYRKEVHDRVNEAFSRGAEFARKSARNKGFVTGVEAVTEGVESPSEVEKKK